MNDTCPNLCDGEPSTKQIPAEQISLPIALESFFAPIDSVHCNSQVLAKTAGVNPLVAAANVILAMLERLKTTAVYGDCRQLHENIVHEIKAFEGAALRENARRDNVLLARFILCATVDDVLLHSQWGQDAWREFSLLKTFYGELADINKFYLLLERLRVNAEQHLDLLELMYLCLATGFTGKYRNLDDGIAMLEEIVDDLYEVIYACRGEHRAVMPELQAMPQTQTTVDKTKTLFPVWLIVLFTLIAVVGMYVGFSYLLQVIAEPAYQQLLGMGGI